MAKSSQSERAQRINAAVELIGQQGSLAQAANALAAHYAISKRQAYRYVREANALGEKVPVPGPKIAFTVKLTETLVQRLRRHAQTTRRPLSEIVTQALEAFLAQVRGRG
jgi:predicted DNA-binding transcriptional regulator YafY